MTTTPANIDSNPNSLPFSEFGKLPWVLLVVTWILVLCTFSMPDRLNGGVSLDTIAKLKVAVRAISVAILAVMLLWHCNSPKCGAVVHCLLPLGLFAIWGIVSVFWSPLKTVSLGQIGSFTALLLLAANFALFWRSQACTSRIFLHLSVALLAISFGLTIARIFFADLGGGIRSEDALVHSTMAGATASLGIVLLLGARLIWGSLWSRFLLFPGLGIHVVQLYLAHSRTAVAATLIACCLLYVIFVNRQVIWAGLLLLCTGTGLYLAGDPGLDVVDSIALSGTNFAQRGEPKSIGNLSGRTEMWETIWVSYLESPWIGHGYFVSSASGELEIWYEIGNWTAHNLVLQALVSTGIIGALLLAWGLWRPAHRMVSTLSRNRHNDSLIQFLIVLGSWYFIWGLMNESIAGPLQPECVVFFSMLGLGIGSALSVVDFEVHRRRHDFEQIAQDTVSAL